MLAEGAADLIGATRGEPAMTPRSSTRTSPEQAPEQARNQHPTSTRKRTEARPTPTKKDAVTSTASTRTTSSTAARPRPPARPGQVSFVGTGPGDPGLLTVRAVELIRAADVVVTEVPEHVALVASLRDDVDPLRRRRSVACWSTAPAATAARR